MLSCLGIIVHIFSIGEYYLFLLPVILSLIFLIFFVPESVPYLLLFSNFYGSFIFEKSYISVTITDIFFLIVVIAYLGSKYIVNYEKVDTPKNSKIISLLILFLITSILSIFFNLPFIKDKYVIISIWYLFKLSQLILTFYIFSDCTFTKDKVERFITLCIILSLLQIPFIWYQFLSANGYGAGFAKTHYAVSGTLTYHHSMLGTFMLIPLFFSLYRLLESNYYRKKFLYGFIVITFTGIIIFSV